MLFKGAFAAAVAAAAIVLPVVPASAVPLPGAQTAPADQRNVIDVREGRGGGGGGGAIGGGGGGPRFGGGGGGGPRFSGGGGGGPRFSGGGGGGPRIGRGGGHRHHGHRHRRGGGIYFGFGAPYYYGNSYYYGSNCDWLYRRAVRTGSKYWWRRYRNCIDD